ncbi:MAG: hypothetical protein CVU87_05410 [Firmicutes bacterium HGW-Firmicutes-12]|jgi:hypothetical protein|nr:MAG: hypothetical protein CVU87_05410 [Firmicutes bacterium HGW-Firmicutes-12]
MRFAFTLTSAESRRLIAKGVVKMPEVQAALKNAYIIIAGGTTNAYVAQELLSSKDIEPQRFTVGLSTSGVLCYTDAAKRHPIPMILYKGEVVKKTVSEAFDDFHLETIVIKGANAIDPEGNVGVITNAFNGGTVPQIIGTPTSQGLKYITPVGLEKLVPSVKSAAKVTGAKLLNFTMGPSFGMFCLPNTMPVTEIEALKTLFNVKATHVASGGIGGNEGAVTIVVEGEEKNVTDTLEFIKSSIKGEPAVPPLKSNCETCSMKECEFNGANKADQPEWLQKGQQD